MYARITPFQLKPGTVDAATAKAETLKDQIMALPGIQDFTLAVNDDGKGYVISRVESREIAEGNADKVMAIWGQMAEYLAERPTPEGFDVRKHWS